MSKNIEVKIFNQTFEISSPRLTPEELISLAHFLDEQMRNTFKATSLSSALKVAVLTALNLAEELRSQNSDTLEVSSLAIAENIIQISHRMDRISQSLEELTDE